MKSILLALCAVILVGCGAPTEPSDATASVASSATVSCEAGTFFVEVAPDVKLTPYVWDMYSDCSATDDPAQYGRAWCCPIGK
jgi:hypothetical protein